MSQKPKHYAIKYKSGNVRLLYGVWDDISDRVIGHKGAVYKGFSNKKEAEEWLSKKAVPFRTKKTPHNRNQHYLYVDGSFSQKTGRSGWGYALIRNKNVIHESFGSCDNEYGSRNIVGELHATLQGVKYCVEKKISPIVIVHDYIGISSWALGYWKARKIVPWNYQQDMKKYMEKIKIRFEKVNGHCGIYWNDYVDELTRMYMGTGK